jgi:hypothetical protein
MIEIYLISWFISNFEPLQWVIDQLWSKIPLKWSKNRFLDWFYIGLGCHKCLSLWLGLIFLNPWEALLLSFIAYVQQKIIK